MSCVSWRLARVVRILEPLKSVLLHMLSLHVLCLLSAAAELLLDDECAGADCAFSALQLQQRQLGVSSCANQTDCDSNRTCVFKEDKTWSQCVPLDDKTFQQECRFWDRKMRLAAINATKILCDSVKCEYDQELS